MNDIHNVLSSAAQLSSCRLMSVASFMESIHLLFGLLAFFLLPSIFPVLPFLKNLSFHDVPEVGQLQFCHWPPVMFQASFILGPTNSSFWRSRIPIEQSLQHHISNESMFFPTPLWSKTTIYSSLSWCPSAQAGVSCSGSLTQLHAIARN